MTEKSEQTPEGEQVPADAVRDSLGVPYGTGDETGQKTYSREGDLPVGTDESENPLYAPGAEVGNPPPATGYVENPDFVPDPTAMSGTLETSGTGGGANETTRGVTGVFEEAGLSSYRSTDVVSGDATGQPEPHAATVAGSAPTSYQETTISGAAPGPRTGEPEGAFTTARTSAEGSEDDQTSKETEEDAKDAQEPAEGDKKASETPAPAKQSAAAKKTAAKKTTASRTQPKT